MDVPSHADIVEQIDRFLDRHPGLAVTGVGRSVNNEPGLVASIRSGRSPSLKMLNRLAEFMRVKDAELSPAQGGAGDHVDGDTVDAGQGSCGKADEVSAAQVAA